MEQQRILLEFAKTYKTKYPFSFAKIIDLQALSETICGLVLTHIISHELMQSDFLRINPHLLVPTILSHLPCVKAGKNMFPKVHSKVNRMPFVCIVVKSHNLHNIAHFLLTNKCN